MAGETKWTKRPWEVRYRFGRKTTVVGRQRYPICDTGTAPRAETNGRREEANAHLIAAAPALYEALEEILAIAEDFVPVPLKAPGFERARAALAQARGEG